MNALLATLIDDDEPAGWTDTGVQFFCGPATEVTVDGVPFVPGARVPASGFTVRWQIDQCWPLQYAFELSGQVELHVVWTSNPVASNGPLLHCHIAACSSWLGSAIASKNSA